MARAASARCGHTCTAHPLRQVAGYLCRYAHTLCKHIHTSAAAAADPRCGRLVRACCPAPSTCLCMCSSGPRPNISQRLDSPPICSACRKAVRSMAGRPDAGSAPAFRASHTHTSESASACSARAGCSCVGYVKNALYLQHDTPPSPAPWSRHGSRAVGSEWGSKLSPLLVGPELPSSCQSRRLPAIWDSSPPGIHT